MSDLAEEYTLKVFNSTRHFIGCTCLSLRYFLFPLTVSIGPLGGHSECVEISNEHFKSYLPKLMKLNRWKITVSSRAVPHSAPKAHHSSLIHNTMVLTFFSFFSCHHNHTPRGGFFCNVRSNLFLVQFKISNTLKKSIWNGRNKNTLGQH